jgi:DNA-binding transcriptional MerR regulator
MTERLKPQRVADLVGVSTSTIRRYEREGLLPAPTRTRSGHRVYTRDDVERILSLVYPKKQRSD